MMRVQFPEEISAVIRSHYQLLCDSDAGKEYLRGAYDIANALHLAMVGVPLAPTATIREIGGRTDGYCQLER